MKKIILSLLVALTATTGANAQVTLTVFDGTAGSRHFPMDCSNFDYYAKSECIIPASELTAMEGGTITAITFYAKTVEGSNPTFGSANQQVFLKEVSGTTLGSFSGMTDATVVFNGLLPMPTTDGYTITFSPGYTYKGGNLLIGVYNDAKGLNKRVTWYGKNSQSDRVSGYGADANSFANVGFTADTFLPKTTFTYTPAPAGPTTSGITWDIETNSGTFFMPAYDVEVSTELWYKVDEEKTLDENIAAYGTQSDFFLNRTLTANVWNTFASPFAIAAGDMTKYFGEGAKVRQLNTTSVDGTVLTLNFTDATSIVAGKPYLVKPAATVDFSANGKEFAGVNLNDATATPTEKTHVNFVPTLGKTEVTGNVKDILILNTSGTLVHPSAVGNMKGFRGYFLMHEAAANLARAFVINFGDGETSGIQPIRMENGTTPAEGTYDLSGRRIQGQPTQKGVYIQNGKKVVVK